MPEMPEIPDYGPLPQPASLSEARAVLRQEAFTAPDVSSVTFKAQEFTALCPKTGQPDFGTIEITYEPGKLCLESKALKFYLWAYRSEGAFAETLAAQIADDIFAAIAPKQVEVIVSQNRRGGIDLQARAHRTR